MSSLNLGEGNLVSFTADDGCKLVTLPRFLVPPGGSDESGYPPQIPELHASRRRPENESAEALLKFIAQQQQIITPPRRY